MSFLARVREAARHPQPHEDIIARQNYINSVTRDFVGGNLTGDQYREKMAQMPQTRLDVVLPHVCLLYGTLRGIGFNHEAAWESFVEERGHFFAAKARGLQPRIELEFSSRNNDEGDRKFYMTPFTAFNPDYAQLDSVVATNIREVVLAAEKLSADDLAKLE